MMADESSLVRNKPSPVIIWILLFVEMLISFTASERASRTISAAEIPISFPVESFIPRLMVTMSFPVLTSVKGSV